MTTDLFDAGWYFGFLDAGYYLSNAVKMTIGYLCLGEDELKRVRYVSPWWFHCRWMNSWLGMWLVCGVCWCFFLFGVLFCCLLCCLVWGVGWLVCLAIHPVFLHTRAMKLKMVVVKWALDLTLETYRLWCFR